MLKKAGIVVAAAAAGMLAVSPLAFATGDDGGHRHHDGQGDTNIEKSYEDNSEETYEDNDQADFQSGVVNVAGNNTSVPVNVCDNQVPVNVLGVQVPLNDNEVIADLSGAAAFGLLGDAEAESETDDENAIGDGCSAESDIEDTTATEISG